jgi:hypothetical protein
MLSYSKGSRGLSVPPRVTGIFTGTTISPSLWSRQRPSRYTIRAGRNLPDKEFRYLRTVHFVTIPKLSGWWGLVPTLHVAMQIGLYHSAKQRIWRIVSEDFRQLADLSC